MRCLTRRSRSFFKKTSAANGHEVVSQAKKIPLRTEEKEDYFDDKGEFLPLSVWVSQGFDGTDIVANTPATDKKTHPVLGLVYRVAILSTGNRGARGTKESEVICSRPTKPAKGKSRPAAKATPTKPAKAVKYEQAEEHAEKEDASDTTSSAESSSSHSSSASAKKKKQH